MRIPLGRKVRDPITGFEGVTVARTEYIGRSDVMHLVQGKYQDKTIPEFWIYECQLEIIDED